jgi:DNA-binding transcriptional LysR family regulator
VRLATTEALAAYLVDRGLCGLKDEHPGLVLELLGGNRPVDLSRGEADLALRVTKPEGANLKVRQLQAQGFGVYGAAGYLRQRGRPRGESELTGHDVVGVGGELGTLPEARWMERQQGARFVLRTNSMPALLAAVRNGVGLAVLPAGWAQVEPDLERLFDVPELPRRPMWLVIQPEAWERAAVRVVAARLKELLDPE